MNVGHAGTIVTACSSPAKSRALRVNNGRSLAAAVAAIIRSTRQRLRSTSERAGGESQSLSEADLEFLNDTHSAAMITVGADGIPKAVRVGVALVDGKLWSSGTADRVRTERLLRDPRCTLFVYDAGYSWVTAETTVTILDGPDAPAHNLRLFRQMQGRPSGPTTFSPGGYGPRRGARPGGASRRRRC